MRSLQKRGVEDAAIERLNAKWCTDGYLALAEAIIKLAAEDLAEAYGRLERCKRMQTAESEKVRFYAQKTATECEMFFRSPMFDILCGSAIAGESVIESIREKVQSGKPKMRTKRPCAMK